MKDTHTRYTLRAYWQATWKYKSLALLSLGAPIGVVFNSVVNPFFISQVLASLVSPGISTNLFIGLFLTSMTIGWTVNMVGIRANMRLQAIVQRDLHQDMMNHLLHRSVGFFGNRIGGKLVSDALDYITMYGQLMNHGLIKGMSFAAIIITGLIILTVMNWTLGLAVFGLFIIITALTIQDSIVRKSLRMQRLKTSKALTSHLSDTLVNAVTVKTFGREPHELQIAEQLSDKLSKQRQKDWLRAVTGENQRIGIVMAAQAMLILYIVHLVKQDPSVLGAGIFAFTYTVAIMGRFFEIGTIIRMVDEAILQAAPMAETLQEAYEITDAPDAQKLTVTTGTIDIRDLSFAYEVDKTNVFDGLDLHISTGQKIGLVGHSGGGKSTLTRLLLRYEDSTKGTITIDGQNITKVTQASLRSAIAYVPQEPLLFHRSISENIAYADPDASQETIEHAAKLANAHDFIMKLPDGYKTVVGERGVKLSGGQRQRVAIARAMLKDSPILILDEATSALDSESEQAIQKALEKLMQGKTSIVIAHRLSTIQKMDRIIVLEDGNIIEDGTHTELLKQKGLYSRLWDHQSGGFIEE